MQKVSSPLRKEEGPKVPVDLHKELLSTPKALTAWEDLTAVGRRDFITWIEGAKQEITRTRRVGIALSKLLAGERRPCCYAIVPMNLYKALGKNPKAKVVWKGLTPMQKRDFVSFIEERKDKDEKALAVLKVCALLSKKVE